MKKPTFFFYNLGGDFLGIQMRLQAEGFKTVAFYHPECRKGKGKGIGCGLIETVDEPFDVINEYTSHPDDLIILIDDNSQGSMCDTLRSFGFPVIGSSEFADNMEHEREEGNKMAEDIGVNIPHTFQFTDLGVVQNFLDKQEPSTKFFFKADGFDLAGGSKTYGAKDIADMKRYLTWIQADQSVHGYTVEKFELQEMVDGVEVDMAVWFTGGKISHEQCVCFEQKKINGLGAAQGCLGQVLTYIPISEPYKTYFERLEPKLAETNGNEWGLNGIVSHSDKQPYFLEWTPRFGWDATFGELALLQDAGIPISQFFMRLAYGRPFPKGFFPVGRYSAAVRLFSESTGTPDKDVRGKPLWVDPSVEKNVWFYGIKKEEGQEGYTLTDTCFAVVTACGNTPEEAIAAVYNIVNPKNGLITTPDIFYSDSIGNNVPDSIRKLKEFGIVDEY